LDEQTSPDQFAMKAAGLRSQHPDWPEPRVHDEVRRIFSHART
jgi:hypothetical protein